MSEPSTMTLRERSTTVPLSMPAVLQNRRLTQIYASTGAKGRKGGPNGDGKIGKGGVERKEGGQSGGKRKLNRLANSNYPFLLPHSAQSLH